MVQVWIVPSEFGKALEGLGSTMSQLSGIPQESGGPRVRVDMGPSEPQLPQRSDAELSSAHAEVQAAIEAARHAGNPSDALDGPFPGEPEAPQAP